MKLYYNDKIKLSFFLYQNNHTFRLLHILIYKKYKIISEICKYYKKCREKKYSYICYLFKK